MAPKTIVDLPLMNTIAGPPVNLAITPDEKLALVANSLNVVDEGGTLKQVARHPALGDRPHDESRRS